MQGLEKKKLGFVLNMLLPAAFSIIKIGIVSHAHAVLRAAFNGIPLSGLYIVLG